MKHLQTHNVPGMVRGTGDAEKSKKSASSLGVHLLSRAPRNLKEWLYVTNLSVTTTLNRAHHMGSAQSTPVN